jgi:hypothetical protein
MRENTRGYRCKTVNLHVELVSDATLGIWNVATRNKAEAWRPLGYIPNLYLLSENENKFRMNSLKKL